MRAEEAKKLAMIKHKEKVDTQFGEILKSIQQRASEGHLQLIYHGYMWEENRKALELLGYQTGNDRGTDSIMISWREAPSETSSSIILP